MKKFSTSFFLLIAAFLAGCQKAAVTHPYYPLSPDALAYIQLGIGKYFVYRDSTTNLTDSVVVAQSILQPVPYNGTYFYSSQQYSLTLMQTDGVTESIFISGIAPGIFEGRVQLISNADMYEFLFQDVATNIPSMTVEGRTYTNVNLTSSLYGEQNGPGTQFTTTSNDYWAKGVGLIKRQVTKGGVTTTYTLLRNN
jgi:hypothetical protein